MIERVHPDDDRRVRAYKFSDPWGYSLTMLVFVGIVAITGFGLYEAMERAFVANVWINGAIIALLLIGVAYTFHQTFSIGPAAAWLRKFQTASRFDNFGSAPAIIAPMTTLLQEKPGRVRISAASARSMLDSVGSRMAEAGEITRYLSRVLIFMGLLGTFWGLLQTVGSLVETVNVVSGAAAANGDVSALFSAIAEPLSGMGTAFSSSLFGLAGSLILGFLDLRASQAQNRFFNEVEDYLAGISSIGFITASGGASDTPSSLVGALFERTSDSLTSLQNALSRAEDSRVRSNDMLERLATELTQLNHRLARQEEALAMIAKRAGDDSVTSFAQSIDRSAARLAGEVAVEQRQALRDMSDEIRTMSKAVTSAIDDLVQVQRKGGLK